MAQAVSTAGSLVINVTLMTVTAVLCFALKWHYSHAALSQLRYILDPIGWIVELVSGHAFRFEAGVGIASQSARIAITRACAGVNFLIVCFAMLAFIGLRSLKSWRSQVGWLAAALTAAYVVTLLVNSLRVLWALHLHREHRVEGTVLYVVALCLTHMGAEQLLARFTASRQPQSGESPDHSRRYAFAGKGRLWIPLGIYLGMTIFVPLLNGASRTQAFGQHALVVSVSTAVVAGVWSLGVTLLGPRRRRTRGGLSSCPATPCKMKTWVEREASS